MQRQLLENTLRELYEDFYDNDLPGMTRRRQVIPELPRCATVVLGMRRTGKTFLLFQRMLDLMGAGVPRDRMLYLNFEDDRLIGMTSPDLRYVADVYYQMFPSNRKRTCYFFFDEIQNVPGWESFARRMTDTPNVQVYMSGSSARLLSKEVATAMRGRSVEVEVLPLSFGEFLVHHGYFRTLPVGFGGSSKAKLRNGLEKYFQVGGMPAVQDVPETIGKNILQGYVDTVIYRDVAERHGMPGGLQPVKFLMQMVFNNPARQISARKIADYLQGQQIRTSRETVSEYLDWLEDAYLVHRVGMFTESVVKRRVNPDKFYLNDVGIVRAMRIRHAMDNGPLLENLVYLHLRRMGCNVEYVRTADGGEVDFITWHPAAPGLRLYQVCYDMTDEKTFAGEVSSLRAAGDALHVEERSVITWNEEDVLPDGVRIVPAWKFLLEESPGEDFGDRLEK